MIDVIDKINPLPANKCRAKPRPLANVRTILIHQTAVAGGFGVTATQQKKGLEQFSELSHLLPIGRDCGLLWRYQTETYHAIYSPRSKNSFNLRHPSVYTFHGHGSNRYSVGWAYDGMFTRDHTDELDVGHALVALTEYVVWLADTLSVDPSDLNFESHRQHSATRVRDPGPEIWANVVMPVAGAMGVKLNSEHVTGTGKPIPESWKVR